MIAKALSTLACAVATGFFLGTAHTCPGHGTLHDQLAAVDAQLVKQPANPELLLWRAELHREHSEWEEAARDIAAGQRAGATVGALAMARAQLAAARVDWAAAASELPMLARELPGNAEAWRVAATVETARGQPAAAAAAWGAAVEHAQPPRPDDFISQARALHAARENDAALAALDHGIAQIGEVPALVEEAIALEESLQRWEAALARLARLIATAPNPAHWLARQGDLAEKAGRPTEAAAARRAALAALEMLPPARRNVPALADLATRLRTLLADQPSR